MLTRKLIFPSTQASTLVRTFTSTSLCRRAPILGDITPDGADAFSAKQKEFREGLEIAKKKKEQAESQLRASFPHSDTSHPNAPIGVIPDAWPESAKGDQGHMSSHSLSETTGEARQAEIESNSPKRSSGKLSTLIYGTDEGRQMDQEMERSFSQVLARGKYVHSIVFHDVKPDKVDEYVELTGNWYPKVASAAENKVNLVGSWRTEVGDCDTFVHIWEYQRYTGYHSSLHQISNLPGFAEFDKKLRTLITSKNSSLMQEFSFWPTTPPRKLGGLFELRSYTLHPGNLLEWETHWRKGLKARREVMEGVGAWFVQIGDLNTVHHLWQFPDLEERKSRREQSWGVEGWADTVHKTVPLIQTMKSKVLVPMPWSPVS